MVYTTPQITVAASKVAFSGHNIHPKCYIAYHDKILRKSTIVVLSCCPYVKWKLRHKMIQFIAVYNTCCGWRCSPGCSNPPKLGRVQESWPESLLSSPNCAAFPMQEIEQHRIHFKTLSVPPSALWWIFGPVKVIFCEDLSIFHVSKIIFLKRNSSCWINLFSVKPVLFFCLSPTSGRIQLPEMCVRLFSCMWHSRANKFKPSTCKMLWRNAALCISDAPSRDGSGPQLRDSPVRWGSDQHGSLFDLYKVLSKSEERHGLNTFHFNRKKHLSFGSYGALPSLSCPPMPCRGELKAVECCGDSSCFLP